MVHMIGIWMRTRLYEDAILEAICFSLIIMIGAGTGVEFYSKVSNRWLCACHIYGYVAQFCIDLQLKWTAFWIFLTRKLSKRCSKVHFLDGSQHTWRRLLFVYKITTARNYLLQLVNYIYIANKVGNIVSLVGFYFTLVKLKVLILFIIS